MRASDSVIYSDIARVISPRIIIIIIVPTTTVSFGKNVRTNSVPVPTHHSVIWWEHELLLHDVYAAEYELRQSTWT